jgi:hypothetical protein
MEELANDSITLCKQDKVQIVRIIISATGFICTQLKEMLKHELNCAVL